MERDAKEIQKCFDMCMEKYRYGKATHEAKEAVLYDLFKVVVNVLCQADKLVDTEPTYSNMCGTVSATYEYIINELYHDALQNIYQAYDVFLEVMEKHESPNDLVFIKYNMEYVIGHLSAFMCHYECNKHCETQGNILECFPNKGENTDYEPE